MKILVTGANGYIGQGVVKQLLKDGHKVVATDLKKDYIDNRAQIVVGNIFEIEDPFTYFGKPDGVLHLTWRNGFVHNAETHLEDLPNHYMFLKKLIDSGIEQVAAMGSMHEIGFYEGSIKSNTPTNPISLYGITKDALRRSVELLADQNKTIFQWIRGFYIVGNSEYGSSVFSKITAAVKKGDNEFPFTMGQNQWDFIDYETFCEFIASIVEQKEYQGIINACSGYPEKLAERVEKFIKKEGYNIKLKYGVFPDRPYDSKAVWGDDSMIRKIMEKKEKEVNK